MKTTIDPDLQEDRGLGAGRPLGRASPCSTPATATSARSPARPSPLRSRPGSTFKMITTTAALQKGVVSLDDEFEYLSGVNVGGRFIENANGEVCGGTFREAFAESCNADFAPLGPKIGNDETGRNRRTLRLQLAADPLLAEDRPRRCIPRNRASRQKVGDELDLGVSAIGQGEVLATPLEMASVAQTIGNGGVRDADLDRLEQEAASRCRNRCG